MQHNLRLVQFLLDLHDAVRLPRVLVFDDILVKLRQLQDRFALGPFRARVCRQELVNDLREQLVRNELGILVVGDDDAGDAFGATVDVESVRYGGGGEGCVLVGWVGAIGVRGRRGLHCSSMSWRDAGPVRSATVPENMVRNSPTVERWK